MPSSDAPEEAQALSRLADVECVVADPLKFKLKLRIGEEAYAILRLKNGLQSLWDVGGVVTTGASIAASKVVVATFFASSGGLLSSIGIGAAAATPIGWVVAAGLVSGGAYYGVTRLVKRASGKGSMVDTIPRFINTPIDLLGMQLFDLVGALALRVSTIDGALDAKERRAIERHFVEEWGYSDAYVKRALDVLLATEDEARLKAIAKALAVFQAQNPDCNAEEMQADLLVFLREVMAADGILDEREEHAIDAVAAVFRSERVSALSKVGKSINDLGDLAKPALAEASSRAGSAMADIGSKTGSAFGALAGQIDKLRPKPSGS